MIGVGLRHSNGEARHQPKFFSNAEEQDNSDWRSQYSSGDTTFGVLSN